MTDSAPPLPPVPTLEKIREHQDGISAIIMFLDWCSSGEGSEYTDEVAFKERAFLAQDLPSHVREVTESPEIMAWRFFGIDPVLVEQERRALLDYQRDLNDRGDS